MRYTDEQLLQSLRDFFIENNVVPKHNQLIVSKECFRHRFGSLSNALIKAGLTPTKQAIVPKSCNHCSSLFTPQKKSQKFCSHSCAAVVVNATRQLSHNPDWNKPNNTCVVCDNNTTYSRFCSRTCRAQHATDTFLSGNCRDRLTIKRQLIKERGEQCQECSQSTWRGHLLPLEVDHIDGDASNNSPKNLRLICPNCHSITPTWKGRNKGNGRKSRGLPIN